ncbi:unnamed protein product [Diplocarpon coronariae]|uniref:Uncharacterized protein n=1 Tax=Diplocarpon coronariae TaxID=2795749 RepID=A0A218ZCX6_9HELO|nr:hypothetical protein B2J93_995 [Marssonina coronariae]
MKKSLAGPARTSHSGDRPGSPAPPHAAQKPSDNPAQRTSASALPASRQEPVGDELEQPGSDSESEGGALLVPWADAETAYCAYDAKTKQRDRSGEPPAVAAPAPTQKQASEGSERPAGGAGSSAGPGISPQDAGDSFPLVSVLSIAPLQASRAGRAEETTGTKERVEASGLPRSIFQGACH